MMVLMQIIGRAYRVGQKHAQTIVLLVSNGTYNQVLLHKYLSNYDAQVAATADLKIPEQVRAAVEQEVSNEFDPASMEGRNRRDAILKIVTEAYVRGLSRSIFGVHGELTES